MASVNEKLADAAVSHAVDFAQYSNGVVQRLIALLNRTDASLFAQLSAALERLPPESFTVDRLEQLLYSVRALNLQAYQAVERELNDTLRQFVAYEAGYQHSLFTSVIPPQIVANLNVATVAVEQVYAAAMARPFSGKLLREWSSGIEAARMARIRDAVRIGFVSNETTGEIVRRIRGTRAKGYSDGLIEIDRKHAEAIARTALSHTAGFVRDRFYEANGSLLKATAWCSTLDGRTTLEWCVPRDGLQYTVGDHKPIGHNFKWGAGPGRIHFCCRSTSVPITKSWKDLGGADIESFSPTTRASMDGQVAADTTFPQWLARQPASRQDEVLGATRGALFRNGGLKIDKFYSDKGRLLTLEELAARDAKAFAKAGVTP